MTTSSSTLTRLAALTTAAATILAATGCTSEPAGADSAHPTTTITTPAVTSTPIPSATSLTEMEQAYADAEKAYRAFTASYAKAARTFDATKLDRATGTPEVIASITGEIKRAAPVKASGATMVWTQKIKDIIGTKYEIGKLTQLQVCAVTNTRFFDKNGKDVTITKDGKRAQPTTTARANQIQLVSTDHGKTWKVDTFVYSGEVGIQC
ncbi:hypothetical protein [Intrasporangium sp.]|uniref:hypothetical protein n=1 Tax=Intrasporangium sp. TaxID=1925024 RepID=UPI003221D450